VRAFSASGESMECGRGKKGVGGIRVVVVTGQLGAPPFASGQGPAYSLRSLGPERSFLLLPAFQRS
jgi:hypothetical protein